MFNEASIIQLLKSGDFTIAYHDNSHCSLYKGRFEYDNLPEAEDYEFDFTDTEGYAPTIVRLLVNALGGKCETI